MENCQEPMRDEGTNLACGPRHNNHHGPPPPKNTIRKRGNTTRSNTPIPNSDVRMCIPNMETTMQKTSRHVPRMHRETNLSTRGQKLNPKHTKQPPRTR